MLTKRVADQLNDQVTKEFYSAYLYLEMYNYFMDQAMEGFAHWFLEQSREECAHALKILAYLHQEGSKVDLKEIPQPELDADNPMEVLLEALSHEESVTESIHRIYDEACQLKDFRTRQFLDWFVEEQAEEEDAARKLVTDLQRVSDSQAGWMLLDRELSTRGK